MATARYYDASKNPEERAFDGVPLRDLTEEEFAELPPWLQASVDGVPFYRKTKPRPASEPDAEAPAEQVDEGDGVEKTATEATADGTPAELTTITEGTTTTTTRRRRD